MLNDRAKLIGAAVLAVAIFALGWKVSSWYSSADLALLKLSHARELKKQSDGLATANAEALTKQKTLEVEIAATSQARYQEKVDAEKSIDALRADLSARRLRFTARCSLPDTSPASGVGNAAARAELSEADSRTILDIAADGDSAIQQLTALQEYVKTITRSH